MEGLFTLSWESVKSAMISTGLMAMLTVLTYVVSIGDIFKLDYKVLVNAFVISIATGFVSLIKNFLTSNNGKFVGAIKIQK